MNLPDSFTESYSHFDQYPVNIIRKETYGTPELSRIRNYLQERAPYLFVDDCSTSIAIHDVFSDGTVDRRNLYCDLEIKKWLGDMSYTGASEIPIVSKKDPRCRFV
jgi:hypothetical protein